MATTSQRAHMHSTMQWLLTVPSQIHYNLLRPMSTAKLSEQEAHTQISKGGSIAPDCSEMVTLICRWAGLKDPSGSSFNYDGYGNSITMYNHLKHYTDPSKAGVGAIVAFGPGGQNHVAMVMQTGNDPIIFSHGSSRGPIELKLSWYQKAEPQQTPTTFLNVSGL